MMNQPLAVLPGGFEVRQSFVPSVGAAQYSPSDPLELLQMCSGLYEMWKRITDMYPFNVRMEERPVWDNQMWESRSGSSSRLNIICHRSISFLRRKRKTQDGSTSLKWTRTATKGPSAASTPTKGRLRARTTPTGRLRARTPPTGLLRTRTPTKTRVSGFL
jgi:hypothetical protein